jgi:DNA polymerase III delta prime subunit
MENIIKNKDNKLFIHKFQPICLNDFNINVEIIELLNTLINMNNLNLLLIGTTASGKSSLLNIIIDEYYKDIPNKQREENILYINNLKEQGINYYRYDVKTFCQTCSIIKNKKKFIILDNIDLINEQGQQIFRNYIDKFSNNVHFISSCTNIQKVIESIQSRLMIIKIKPIKKENLINLMNKIKISENIIIDVDAEEFIINISNNTIKILINYMEKFKLFNEKITLQIATHLCSNISFIDFENYTICLKNKNLNESIQLIYNIYNKGYSVMDILDNYFIFIKITILLNETEKYNIIPFICKYITIFNNIHEDQIELALFTNNLIKIL